MGQIEIKKPNVKNFSKILHVFYLANLKFAVTKYKTSVVIESNKLFKNNIQLRGYMPMCMK